MSEEQVRQGRQGWRGQAAGIPPVRVLMPAGLALPPSATGPYPSSAGPASGPAGPAEDFPLWPTTTTIALHESIPAPEDPGAASAHEAGRVAVVDHLAGRAEQWPPPAMRAMRQARDARRTSPERRVRQRRVRRPRGPVAGLSAMLLIALLAGFFAWTSAEPFWLDMGHRVRGTAKITSCQGAGVLRRCLAEFTRAGDEPVKGTRLVGLEEPPGSSMVAQMVPGGRITYAGNPSGLRVRWAAGLGLVVLCGIVLAWLTGAWRFGRLRDRLTAWTLTAAAPLVLGAAIVIAAY